MNTEDYENIFDQRIFHHEYWRLWKYFWDTYVPL